MPVPRGFSLALAGAALARSGCAGIPADALKLGPTPLANRQMQTRTFADQTEPEMLAASAGVLQDLGFTLDESDRRLGLVSASRSLTSRRALSGGEIAKGVAWAVVLPSIMGPYGLYRAAAGTKEPQLVRVSLVTSALADASGASVRVTAQRIVYRDEQHTKVSAVEPLNDPKFYEEFSAASRRVPFWRNKKMRSNRILFAAATASLLLLAGCFTPPALAVFDTGGSQVQLRSYQTRAFATTDREKTLRTVIATMQDLGFVISRADADLGAVTGTKLADYEVRMSVTVRPRGETQLLVRANAQCSDPRRNVAAVPIADPAPYRDFFAALGKSMFLEAQQVD